MKEFIPDYLKNIFGIDEADTSTKIVNVKLDNGEIIKVPTKPLPAGQTPKQKLKKPKLPDGVAKDRRASFRLSNFEYELLEKICAEKNYKPSDYFRECLKEPTVQKVLREKKNKAKYKDLLIELGRIGNNLNQIVREMNMKILEADDPKLILQTINLVCRMSDELRIFREKYLLEKENVD